MSRSLPSSTHQKILRTGSADRHQGIFIVGPISAAARAATGSGCHLQRGCRVGSGSHAWGSLGQAAGDARAAHHYEQRAAHQVYSGQITQRWPSQVTLRHRSQVTPHGVDHRHHQGGEGYCQQVFSVSAAGQEDGRAANGRSARGTHLFPRPIRGSRTWPVRALQGSRPSQRSEGIQMLGGGFRVSGHEGHQPPRMSWLWHRRVYWHLQVLHRCIWTAPIGLHRPCSQPYKGGETPNWDEIMAAMGDLGTRWRITAKGCSWCNGLAERVIRVARHTLAHKLCRGAVLDFHKFSLTLSIVASILNSRPLSVRATVEADFVAISPCDVLLGRAGKSERRFEQEMEQLSCFEDDESPEGGGRPGSDHR